MAKAALAVIVVLALAAGAGWFVFRAKVSDAAAGLQQDALAQASEKIPRPLFAPPLLKGDFGACVGPRLDAFTGLLEEEPEVCKAFRAPKAPPAKIPDECLAIVTPTNALAWARGLMACSHSDAGGYPEGLYTRGHKRNVKLHLPWLRAAKVLAWEIRGQVAAGQSAAALDTCLDVFGSARDLGPHGGLVPTMAGVELVRTVFPACADAVVVADAITRKSFHNALELIRRGAWPRSKTIRDERVVFGLEWFGFALDAKQREALPKEMGARIGPRPAATFYEGYQMEWAMVQQRAVLVALEAVADMREDERAPVIAALEQKYQNPLAGSPATVGKFLHRFEAADALLEMLAAAADVTEKPQSNSRYTVVPADPGVLLTPTDPDSAQFAIHLLR